MTGLGFTGGSVVENPPANVGDVRDMGSIPGLGRFPEEGSGNPLQYSCLENPHKQRSLAGYSPWGHKKLDTTGQLSTRVCVCVFIYTYPHSLGPPSSPVTPHPILM